MSLTSPFNRDAEGRRFTIAHELCHVLFDRSRARRVAHSSGPWAAPAIEKRANAFAAYLLMPPALVCQVLAGRAMSDEGAIREASSRLHVNESAPIEHLYNLGMIDETERETLRNTVSPGRRLAQ